MDAARQVALNWAFLMDVMDMTFDELYPLFKVWCDGLPEDKMADIMATADQLSDATTTVNDILGDLDDAPTGTWIEDFPTEEFPTKIRPEGGWKPSLN